MTSVKFERSDNKTFTMGEGSQWGVYSINGLDAAEYTLFTENRGVGDGDVITGERVSSRTLEFKAKNRNTTMNAMQRAEALQFFNPKYSYKIYIEYMDGSHWIEGRLSGLSCPVQNVHGLLRLSVSFFCVDPYLKSLDDFGKDIASQEARWGFPYMDSPDLGTLVSVYNFGNNVELEYDGDVAAPFTVTITADGDVVNPKIIKDDYFIRIIDTMTSADTFVINLDTLTVTKNGENAMAKVDRASDFTEIKMQPGMNTISYSADTGENLMHVRLSYYKNYLGG